jgi:hypothetical protein
MELTKEKSEELADWLMMIKPIVNMVDVEYLRACAEQFRRDASHYDATAVVNYKWNQHGSDYQCAMADQLSALADYIDAGKRVDALRAEVNTVNEKREEISKLFGL